MSKFTDVVRRLQAGELEGVEVREANSFWLITAMKGMPGVVLYDATGVVSPEVTKCDGQLPWPQQKHLACWVCRHFELPFQLWAGDQHGLAFREPVVDPHHLEYGNMPGFKASHWKDRLKTAIGWLGNPWFLWEEPGVYTPQLFAQWGRLGDVVRIQSGGFGQNTGLQLIPYTPAETDTFTRRTIIGFDKVVARKLVDIETREPPSRMKARMEESHRYPIKQASGHWGSSQPNALNVSPTGRLLKPEQAPAPIAYRDDLVYCDPSGSMPPEELREIVEALKSAPQPILRADYAKLEMFALGSVGLIEGDGRKHKA